MSNEQQNSSKQVLLDTLKYFCYGVAFGVGLGVSNFLVPNTIELYFPQVDPALESLTTNSENLLAFVEELKKTSKSATNMDMLRS